MSVGAPVAAFRRVAEVVAHGADLDLVLAAVTTEASTLLGGLATASRRRDPDGSTVTVTALPVTCPRQVRRARRRHGRARR